MHIYTENLGHINFRNLEKSAFPDLNEPAICLINTDLYTLEEVTSFQKLLSRQEQEKAVRFRFVQDQRRYIVTHGMLRNILGNYLKSAPAEIEFSSNEYGKPALSGEIRKIHFNLSHSSGISAMMFSATSEIGIDIEKMDPKFNFKLISEAYFSRAENNFLDMNPVEACERFYTIWTRKEALLKALGTGIGENLEIEVFREVNPFNSELFGSKILPVSYHLSSFSYQVNYLITIAEKYSEEFNTFIYN